MSRNAAIFERSTISSPPAKPIALPATPRPRHFIELAANLFPVGDVRQVVAFGSVGQGAGVTTVVRSLADELARSEREVEVLTSPLVAQSELRNILGAPTAFSSGRSAGSTEDAIEAARLRNGRILIDCGSLACSVDLLQLAPMVDGVVLVVEAGKTEKQQIERAVLSISNAGGKVLGLVMNKRRYPVPNWLYRFL